VAAFRVAIVLLLVASGVAFAFFAVTGEPRYKRLGLVILKWTLVAAAGFFAVLALQRLF
jgi:hypothetical protein